MEYYKNKVQTVEMYSLEKNSLENVFQKREESYASAIKGGLSCFAISKNESLFTYCRGTDSVTIYLMENGLEITTKQFKERNVRKILFFDFVQDDSKLLLVIEEESYNENTEGSVVPVVVILDLFSILIIVLEKSAIHFHSFHQSMNFLKNWLILEILLPSHIIKS